MTRTARTFAFAVLIASGCAPQGDQNVTDDFSSLDGKTDTVAASTQMIGPIAYDEQSAVIAYQNPPKYIGFTFRGRQGDAIQIFSRSPDQSGDSLLFLLSSGKKGAPRVVATNDNAASGGTLDSELDVTLPVDDHYLILVRDTHLRAANFQVQLVGPPESMTWEQSRIEQADIDSGKIPLQQVFDIGDFMFGHRFTVDQGLGNGLSGGLVAGNNPRPNGRLLQVGKFGGPDAAIPGVEHSCMRCHQQGGGDDGSGALEDMLFQDSDGVNQSTALLRNPISLLGVGFVQQLGIEMTADLAAQVTSAKQQAAATGTPQTISLVTKGVSFGTLTANVDGTVDSSGLQGIDADLVVKPFGWKGRIALLRRFVEGGFQVHFGMASDVLIAKRCAGKIGPEVVGDGPDCNDPDSDGVTREITEGQLTAMSVYAALQQVPKRQPIGDPTRTANGEALFNQIGCNSCHVQSLTLNNPIHNEVPDLTGGAPLQFNLTTDTEHTQLAANPDGTVTVELWSDLKRHDMGPSLADAHSSFGVIAANLFLTPPLWDVGATAPYMHDGRAGTLNLAIRDHGGEAAAAALAYRRLSADERAQLVEFLQTLSRDPNFTH
jgi:mono/diheme cytochrome c family protein